MLSTAELQDFHLRAASGDAEACSQLMTHHQRLVKYIVSRFGTTHYEYDDLLQLGSIGLFKAIQRFKPELGLQFSTYAVPLIIGEIRRFLRDDGTIKISRSLKETTQTMQRAREILWNRLGREPKIAELAAETGIAVHELVTALEAAQPIMSIFEPVGNDGQLLDLIPGSSNTPHTASMFLRESLHCLDELEQRLISLRYFADKTQQETANILGTSQVQISRLERRAILKLRQIMQNNS